MTLPQFQYPQNALLDFSPVTNAFARVNENSFKQANIDNQREHTQIQRDTFGLHQAQFEHQQKVQKAQMIGQQAMAIDQMPPGPERTAAYQRLLAQHPDSGSLADEYHNPLVGPRMIAADAGQFRDKLAEDLKRSQIAAHYASAEASRAHGRAYDAMAQYRTGQTAPVVDPTFNPRLRMNADGDVYEAADQSSGDDAGRPRIMSSVLGSSASDPGSVRREHVDYGPMGTMTTDVPGIVTTPKGTMDTRATDVFHGQRALDKLGDEDRRRYLEWQDKQNRNNAVYGKAPSGFRWNDDGTLKDLKDDSKKAISRDKIAALIDDVKTAKDVLTSSYLPSRLAGHYSGGWLAPEKEQAMRSVEHAVQFLTAEVEGKRHANAQDVRMLRFFAPAPSDSAEMIGFKLDQLNRIMQGYFGAKVQSGSLFKSVLSQAQDARIKREAKSQASKAPPAAVPTPQGGDLSNMSTDDLVRMLGR